MGESEEAGEKEEGKSKETKKSIAAVHIYRHQVISAITIYLATS